MHGTNGLNPSISRKLWYSSILPRLIHGAELWMLSDAACEPLEKAARRLLRCIQTLPDSTANPAVYGLLGLTPIVGEIHRRAFQLFYSMIKDQTCREFNIILRQLAVKEWHDHSWVSWVNRLLARYHLPSAHTIIFDPPPKKAWKENVNMAISTYWAGKLWSTAKEKTTLKHTTAEVFMPGPASPVWTDAEESLYETKKAIWKARALSGTLTLQTSYRNPNQNERDTTCKLCSSEAESIEHFILRCPALEQERRPHQEDLERMLHHLDIPIEEENTIMAVVLNSRHPLLQQNVDLHLLEQVTRNWIFYTYRKRLRLLNAPAPPSLK
jgi:hypothetical protein